MPSIRISIAQINTTVGDLEANQSKIISYIEKARQDRSDVIVLPELTVTGYPPEDLLHKPHFVDQNMTSAQKVAEATQDICAVYGFVESQNGLYNSAAIAHNGKLISTYQKQLLPNYGVFDEKRYFTHGENTKIYRLSGVNIGINICEDIWSHSGPIKEQSDSGAELILNINASPYHVNKQFERTAMLSRRAKDNNVHIVYAVSYTHLTLPTKA